MATGLTNTPHRLIRATSVSSKGEYRLYAVRYSPSDLVHMRHAAKLLGISLSDAYRIAARAFVNYTEKKLYTPELPATSVLDEETREHRGLLAGMAGNLNKLACLANAAHSQGHPMPAGVSESLIQMRRDVAHALSGGRP